MYEFHRVGESTCYLSAPTNIGIYLRGKDAYLIDAGSRDADADQILRVLGENGLTLAGVISTHAHADHTGGNRRLQDVTGCPVFASAAEGAIIANPILNTSLLYGSYPPEELRRVHYLYARGCRVSGFEHPAFPKELEILPLPGHSVGMVAVRTPDGVLFAADAVVDENAWKKGGAPYLYRVGQALESLDRLEHLPAKLYIPSHAAPTKNISVLTCFNRERILATRDRLLDMTTEPISFDDVVGRFAGSHGLWLDLFRRTILGSSLCAYLSWMLDDGLLETMSDGERLLWRRSE